MNDDWHMLAEEERLFCDVLTRICAEQIAPKAHTDEAAAFVHDQLAVLGQAGMMGANLPEDYDGSGVSARRCCTRWRSWRGPAARPPRR